MIQLKVQNITKKNWQQYEVNLQNCGDVQQDKFTAYAQAHNSEMNPRKFGRKTANLTAGS